MILINKAGVDMKDPETQGKVKLAFGISQVNSPTFTDALLSVATSRPTLTLSKNV